MISAGASPVRRWQLAVHALDRAGDRVGAAAHQRVAGVGGESRPPRRSAPSGRRCPSRARAASGRSRAGSGRRGSGRSASSASTVTAVPTITTSAGRGGRARARGGGRRSAPPSGRRRAGSDGRSRWSRRTAERRAHHPARLDVPELELLLDAAADALAGDDAAEHARRRRQLLPLALGQVVDRLEEDRAVRRSGRRPACGAAYSAHLRRVLPMSMARNGHRPRLRSACRRSAARCSR